MREEYRGYPIHIDVGNGKVTCPGLGLSADTVSELKTLINTEMKTESVKYTPVKALFMSWNDDKYEEVTITRPAEDRYSRDNVWITRKGGKRSKEIIDKLYAFECKDKLDAILKRINKLQAEIEVEEKARYKLPRAKIPVAAGEKSNG